MAINSYTPPPNKVLENLMGIVKTLGDLGVIDTPANQKEKAATTLASTQNQVLVDKAAEEAANIKSSKDINSPESQYARLMESAAIKEVYKKDPARAEFILRQINGEKGVPAQLGAPLPERQAVPEGVVDTVNVKGPSGEVPEEFQKPDILPLSKFAIDRNKDSFYEKSALANLNNASKEGIAKDRINLTINNPNSARMQSLEERRNQNSVAAGQSFEKDPLILASKRNINATDRGLNLLNNPNKPLSGYDLKAVYQDYINSIAPGGAATEGKANREIPETMSLKFNRFLQTFGENEDIRSIPSAKELVDYLTENMRQVRIDLKDAIKEQSLNIAESYTANTNPKVQQVVKSKLKLYTGDDTKEESQTKNGSDKQVPHLSDEEVVKAYNLKHGIK